jgi:REP element-mobilizing transposase RayT
MARPNRIKATDREAWHHVYARAAEFVGKYPFEREGAWRKLTSFVRHYTEAYFCQVSAYTWMGNHSHMVVHFEAPREVEREELFRRALLLHPGKKKLFDRWQDEAWEHFRCRLFDVSELMRNIQGEFGKWFNWRFERRGHFWSERFQSSLLADEDAVLDCMLYAELNPVRAGLTERPEEWEHGSAYCRHLGLDDWLMPLQEVFPRKDPESVADDYRARLYRRGAVEPEKGGQAIPPEIVADEERRGFKKRGAYLERMRHFKRGLILGSREAVSGWIAVLQAQRRLPRRRKPVRQGTGGSFTLRSQPARASPT